MKITVKTIDGKCAEFEVSEEATVQQLKDQIVGKLSVPLEKQRLIFQGKVLRDDKRLKTDCGIDDGKVLHLVLNAPQPAATGGSTTSNPVTMETGDADSGGDPMVLNFLHMQSGMPPDLASITQNIVESVVSNFTSEPSASGGGSRPVTVSAVAQTVDSHGNTLNMSSATASTGDGGSNGAPPPPPPHSSTSSSQPTAPPPPSSTTPRPPPSSSTTAREAAEQLRRQEESIDMERERATRQLRNIQSHVKTVRRCLQFATKVLERYERAEAATLSAESAEPMEVSGEGAAQEVGGAGGGAGAKPPQPMQFEHPPLPELRPVREEVYMLLLRHLDALSERARPLHQRHLNFATREDPLTQAEVLSASRVATTVRDFNYYFGHASVAFSRLNLNMAAAPPRSVMIVPPRRTEMRHIMHQFQAMHPPQPPSSYLIDISRDRSDPETGETVTESTSARVDRGSAGGPLGAALLGGVGGEGGRPLGPIRIEAGFNVRRSDEDRARETAAGGGEGESGGDGARTINVDVRRLPGNAGTQIDVRDSATGGQLSSQTYPPTPPEGVSLATSGLGGGEGGGGEGEGGSEDETPQYLARLVSELITGVPISQQQGSSSASASGATGGAGERPTAAGGEGEEGNKEKKDGEDAKSSAEGDGGAEGEEGEGEPRTFAERYAGPEGTTVTIQAAPQPAFGIPGFSPVEGPSISITNPGGGRRPEMNVNFPVPPALQLLQNLLQRAAEREGREGEDEEDEDEEEDEEPTPVPQPPMATASNPFAGEDDIGSISDAGSLDSISSDHEGPGSEMIVNPLTRLANVAASEMNTGARQSMHTTLNQMRADIGAPEEDESSFGMVELLLQAISKDLSVVELMSIFQGQEAPLQQLQPGLLTFIREKCLAGAPPKAEERSARRAVETFLSGCIPAVAGVSDRLRLRDSNIDFVQTLYECLHGIFLQGYYIIIKDYSGCGEQAFAHELHAWGVASSALFANLLRYCIASDQDFVGAVKLLLSTLFPPNTPSALLDMCNSSVLKHMQTIKDSSSLNPTEMEKHVVWLNAPSSSSSARAAAVAAVSKVKGGATTSKDGDKDGEPEVRSKPTAGRVGQKEGGGGGNGPTSDVANGASSRQARREAEKFDRDFMRAMLERRSVNQGQRWQGVWETDRKMMEKDDEEQRPFSYAYASGMPTKKRKVKQLDVSECQPVTASQLLGRTMARCLETTGATPIGKTKEEMVGLMEGHAKLGATLGAEMHYLMGERLAEDADFDPERFPNAQKYYEPKKQ